MDGDFRRSVLNVSTERKALFGPRPTPAVSDAPPVVLVVDDDEAVAEAYAASLRERYTVRVAYGGEAALAAADGVDAVVLDRRLSDRDGDDVLAALRRRGIDAPVIMTTAVDPDLNILELDFDDYLTKPVDGATLRETVERHLDVAGRDPRLSRFFGLVSKLAVLREERPAEELAESDDYQRLEAEAAALADDLRDSVSDFDELVAVHREIGDEKP
jgi:DNA-binding response OmpR family regulator